jgi:hypothetical protein
MTPCEDSNPCGHRGNRYEESEAKQRQRQVQDGDEGCGEEPTAAHELALPQTLLHPALRCQARVPPLLGGMFQSQQGIVQYNSSSSSSSSSFFLLLIPQSQAGKSACDPSDAMDGVSKAARWLCCGCGLGSEGSCDVWQAGYMCCIRERQVRPTRIGSMTNPAAREFRRCRPRFFLGHPKMLVSGLVLDSFLEMLLEHVFGLYPL